MTEAKQSLIPILTNQYQRLYEIEAHWDIRLHEGDQRPRIDYFHDAVRALSSGEADLYAKNSRLSVEHLAYDIAQLRQAQAHPAGTLNRRNRQSPHTDLVKPGEQGSYARGLDRAARAEIAQLYKDYAVLFSALFAEIADMNFQSRQDEIDAAVEDLALVEQVLRQLAEGQITAQQADQMLEQVEQDGLRAKMQQAVSAQTIRHIQAEQIIAGLRRSESRLEAERQAINQAHMTYVTSQLAVYEESKDTVKRLAAQGLNLAGKFVENALGQSAGRGGPGMGV